VPQHRSDRQPVSHTDAVFSRHCHSLWGFALRSDHPGATRPLEAISRLELLQRHTPLYSFLYGRI